MLAVLEDKRAALEDESTCAVVGAWYCLGETGHFIVELCVCVKGRSASALTRADSDSCGFGASSLFIYSSYHNHFPLVPAHTAVEVHTVHELIMSGIYNHL